jgi:hypothetical protein
MWRVLTDFSEETAASTFGVKRRERVIKAVIVENTAFWKSTPCSQETVTNGTKETAAFNFRVVAVISCFLLLRSRLR